MQTAGSADGGLLLECQNGGIENHYQAAETATLELAKTIFSAYLENDISWRGNLKWKKLKLTAKPKPNVLGAFFNPLGKKIPGIPVGIWLLILFILALGVSHFDFDGNVINSLRASSLAFSEK